MWACWILWCNIYDGADDNENDTIGACMSDAGGGHAQVRDWHDRHAGWIYCVFGLRERRWGDSMCSCCDKRDGTVTLIVYLKPRGWVRSRAGMYTAVTSLKTNVFGRGPLFHTQTVSLRSWKGVILTPFSLSFFDRHHFNCVCTHTWRNVW